ncbi:MAG: ATP-binding cassette domain-containing protein [Gaiellaceae bacterium]
MLVAGGLLYRRGDLSIGSLAAFLLYLTGLFDPVARITEWLGEFQSGRAALAKIVGLIETPAAIVEAADAVELPEAGALRVEGVTFAYDGDPVLVDVDLRIEPGEHVALVGSTGAGKSTLAKLLSRAYDPGVGTVSYGGVDEATSGLDPATERDVERALGRLREGRTVVTIAHRLSTAQRADRVVVLEQGRLVEHDSHKELVAGDGRYAALWHSWRSGGGSGIADAAEPV